MQTAPVITYRHIEPSPAVESLISRRIAKLERLDGRLIGCEVALEAPQKRRQQGTVFKARVVVQLPGPDLAAARTVTQGSARDDIQMALNRAFAAAEKRLRRRKDMRRGVEVKRHPPFVQGEVAEIEQKPGRGIIRTADGREVPFERGALTGADWKDLAPGTRVRFREHDGDNGPFATAVARIA